MEYRQAGEINARDYLDKTVAGRRHTVLDLLGVWATEARDPSLKREVESLKFSL